MFFGFESSGYVYSKMQPQTDPVSWVVKLWTNEALTPGTSQYLEETRITKQCLKLSLMLEQQSSYMVSTEKNALAEMQTFAVFVSVCIRFVIVLYAVPKNWRNIKILFFVNKCFSFQFVVRKTLIMFNFCYPIVKNKT